MNVIGFRLPVEMTRYFLPVIILDSIKKISNARSSKSLKELDYLKKKMATGGVDSG